MSAVHSRSRLPGGLHQGGRGRERPGPPDLRRRTLRRGLRDQPLSRCIFCGYCEVGLPFDAIDSYDYEMSDYNRAT